MALKVFEGFQLEMVSELSLLSASSINTLRRHGMVTPVKQSGGYLYSFADVLTLRVIRQLRENDVPLKNIVKAHDYLSKLNTSKSLFNLEIAVRKDTGEVVAVGENLVNLSRHGQLQIREVCHIIPIGRTLERVRKNIVELDRRLTRKPKTSISLAALRKKYA
ncbi:MAG: MerR family transcriptional regulator [Candidatus Obscuribacter sp.]|nr:MerR family transcriptional regulator [Candidatus Obscuribacter sp.]